MAIEVIGKDESVKQKTTCTNCASILLYTNADTEIIKVKDYTGSVDVYTILTCPVCQNQIYVKSKY